MNLLFANDRQGEFPPSWYAATAAAPAPFGELRGERRVDVCVVGGGFTGISAALHLAEAGLHVALVDAHRVGFGASGRNGGQLGTGHRQSQRWLLGRVGRGEAHALWTIAEDAKAAVHGLTERLGIDAEYRPGLVWAMSSQAAVDEAWDEADFLESEYGYDGCARLDRAGIGTLIGSESFVGGVIDRGAGHLNPLKLAFGLAQAAAAAGVQVFERSHVHHIHQGAEAAVRTGKGCIRARHVVLAVNGYHGHLDRKVASRVMPLNNFIVATRPLGDAAAQVLAENVAVFDDRFVVSYWRLSQDGRLLFGGGESYGDKFPRDIAAVVRKPLERIYPQLKGIEIDYAWGGTLGITATRLPFVARTAPNMLTAGGYSGHGVALAVLTGRILAEAILGQAGRFDTLARLPVPPFPGGYGFRRPVMSLAMSWFALRDRLGI